MSGESESARARIERALADLVDGRVDTAHFHPDTGLLALLCYVGEKRWLGVGIGAVNGVGLLGRAPRLRAASSHPVVAALRAHVVDHRVHAITVHDDGSVHIVTGAGEGRRTLELLPARRGRLELRDHTGKRVVVFPLGDEPVPQDEGARWLAHPESADLAARGARMVARSDRVASERAHTDLQRAIRKRVEWLERRFEAVQRDLARLESVARLQMIGRMLLAQGPRIARGATRAELENWEEGGTIEVTLDPAIPAKQQAETFFNKARRIKRGETFMRKRLDETAEAQLALESLLENVRGVDLDAHGALEALDQLAVQARALGVRDAVAPSQRASGAPRKETRVPFHTFRSEAGKPVLVGRGGHDNDLLLTRFARPHDLWLHARNVHGAHVIVPLEKSQQPTGELLADAATLALHFSDARDESAWEVTYAFRRHVRKPRGSAPGAVLFDHDKVLVLRAEPERLARLIATREDGN